MSADQHAPTLPVTQPGSPSQLSPSSAPPDSRSPSSGAQRVGAIRASLLCYRILIRQIVSVGRLVALGAFGGLWILVGWVVGNSADHGASALRDGASYADVAFLILIVPIVSLVFASAALGDARDDGTLVYLWLRPIGRAPLVVAAAGAAVTVSLPLCVMPTVAGGWLATDFVAGSGAVALGALAAAALGTIAYSCLFVLAGLLFRKAVLWGIAYILLWEGLAVGLGEFAERLSLRGYSRSLLARIAEVDLGFTSYELLTAVVVLVLVSAVSLALATLRLSRLSVD